MTFKTKILIKKIKNFTIDFGPVLNQLKKETSLVTEGISTIGTNRDWGLSEQVPQALLQKSPSYWKIFKAVMLEELKEETPLVTEGISTIGTNTQTESVQQAFQAEDLSFLSNAANTIAKHPDLTDLFVTALDKSSQM